jgi:hypothetical protein
VARYGDNSIVVVVLDSIDMLPFLYVDGTGFSSFTLPRLSIASSRRLLHVDSVKMDPVLLTMQRLPMILSELVSCGATMEFISRVGAMPYNCSNFAMFVVLLFVSRSTAFIVE